MYRNLFKIAFRNLAKRKVYTAINLTGLSFGLVACLLIFLFVKSELTYDQFHTNSDQVFRIARSVDFGGQFSQTASTNYSLADYLGEKLTEVKSVVRIAKTDGMVSTSDKSRQFNDQVIHLSEPDFFKIFDVSFLSGNAKTALDGPNKIILTQSTAERYFGKQDPMGQTIILDQNRSFLITGVVEDWPTTSHFEFEMLASLSTTKGWYSDQMFEHWGNTWVYTYLLTDPGITADHLTNEATNVAMEFGPPVLAQFDAKFFAQPLTSIHLGSNLSDELDINGSRTFVQIFIAVGLLIVLIACFNFINLATARASWRAKEVGLRKVVGARKDQLISQFLGESILLTLGSVIMAVILAFLFLPTFSQFVGREITYMALLDPGIAGFVALVVTVVGVGAGLLPAIYLSGFQPIQVLRGNKSVGDTILAGNLRKVLVAVQFTISIVLVVSAFTVFNQLDYIRNMELGFQKDQVLVVDLYNSKIREKIDVLRTEISALPGVSTVGSASDSPPKGLNSWWLKNLDDPERQPELISLIAVDHDFTNALGFEISEGRFFDPQFTTDATSGLLLNEAAVDYLGLTNPVGTRFDLQEGLKSAIVIGVVKDFHFNSVHTTIDPVMMHIWPGWLDQLFIKVDGSDYQGVITAIADQWNQTLPDWELSYHFLDADFENAYQAEQRFSQMILVFSGLALLIGMLGLFGLASYVAEQKLRELGIRKVLGAAMGSMVWIQFRVFTVPLVLSLLMAIPVSYYFLEDWLSQFAYHVDLQWWLFAAGGLTTLMVSMATVGMHSIRAALANPIDSLRNE